MPDAVVFDLDGVLADSEHLWDAARRRVVKEHGGQWTPEATTDMLGMSAPEWSRYVAERLGVGLAAEEINAAVVAALGDQYRSALPLIPGAAEAVRALAKRWPLGLASSANAQIIQLFLDLADLRGEFAAWVSSEEVQHGKPAPDVYLEAARRLGVDARRSVAVEDSTNGLRSAAAAGMAVVAVPNPAFPPEADALDLAAVSISAVGELTPEVIERAAASRPASGST